MKSKKKSDKKAYEEPLKPKKPNVSSAKGKPQDQKKKKR